MKNNPDETTLEEELIPDIPKKKIRDSRIFKIVWNRYFILSIAFAVWMIFFDQNSFFVIRELNKQIRLLEIDETYFKENLSKEKEKLDELNNSPSEIERIAREQHFLKKEDEDIFIIQKENADKSKKK